MAPVMPCWKRLVLAPKCKTLLPRCYRFAKTCSFKSTRPESVGFQSQGKPKNSSLPYWLWSVPKIQYVASTSTSREVGTVRVV
jgi:hypothetical protein